MKCHRVLGVFVLAIGVSVIANAQATRTWVSGVGDDANPCSRTAPCKTWAGAISKTAPGGEIDALDPGGFGAVTITKSITFEGADFTESTLVSGTNGIVIQAAATDHVQLRKIRLAGVGSGVSGIQINSAAQVAIEECTIFDFITGGITITPSTSGNVTRVSISDTSIRNIAGFGVRDAPSGGAAVVLSMDNVRITGTTANGSGLPGNGSAVVVDGSGANVAHCVLSENAGAGLFVRNGSEVNVYGTTIYRNGTGVSCGDAGGGTVRLFLSSVVTNGTGLAIISGNVFSHGNNAIQGNGGNQAPSSNINTQ
jgi:hypothetical protein